MPKAKKKPAKVWPTQHLVLWRTTLDDIPLLLTPDRREASEFAKNPPAKAVRRCSRLVRCDMCSPVNIAIVSFRRGKPYRMEIVTEEPPDINP